MTLPFKPWRSVFMPDGSRICIVTYVVDLASVRLFDENHNILRLDIEGKIVWQVKRDEQGHRYLGPLANDPTIEGQLDGLRDPFMYLSLRYANGTDNISSKTGTPPLLDCWRPGCTVYASSLGGHGYVLDIERGIAINFSGSKRAW